MTHFGVAKRKNSGLILLVQERCPRLDRSGRCEEPGGSNCQRQVAGGCLAHAVSRGRGHRSEAWRQRSIDQGNERLGQPADRRSTTGCDDEIYVHNRETLQRKLAVAAFRTLGTGTSLLNFCAVNFDQERWNVKPEHGVLTLFHRLKRCRLSVAALIEKLLLMVVIELQSRRLAAQAIMINLQGSTRVLKLGGFCT